MALPKDDKGSGTVAKYLDDYPSVDPDSCELLGPTALVCGSRYFKRRYDVLRWTGRPGLNGYHCHSLACL